MADRILNKKHETGPYLFREAQLTVFRGKITNLHKGDNTV